MISGQKKKLGNLLVESGKLSEFQLMQALDKQRDTKKRLGEIIIEEGWLTEEEIFDVLQMQLGYKRIQLNDLQIGEEVTKLVPLKIAQKYTLMPIEVKGNVLSVAMEDPLNLFALDDISITSGFEVKVLLATKSEILKAIDKYYSGQNLQKAAEELTREQELTAEQRQKELDDVRMEEEINSAPIVKLVDSVIREAIKLNTSDIHIEPFEKQVKIRYRIDGELQLKQVIPIDSLAALVTRIKIMSNLNIAEKRIPQDGRMKIRVENRDIDMRVSILPTIFGEKTVIRILNNSNFLLTKKDLGMDQEDLRKLENIIKVPYGIVLVTGPTGSGKSTTLYTVLKEINRDDINVITVEDPVEFVLEGVNQVNVNTKAGLTFASGLRSILRQDPDVIMIGEIRDAETAEIAIRAAITGHLVLSTIHTNDAPSTVIRLADMGIQPYLVGSSVVGIIAQRLVRRICNECVEEYEASDYEKKLLEVEESESIILKRGKGCPRCGGTGYSGRLGVYEIMEIGKELRDLISRGADAEVIKAAAIENGMKTIKVGCINLVLQGKTTMDEYIKTAFIRE
ncbi:GspE/PulE family protein [Clostridium thermarum]|uniref:GspE/PulE family protein n=1 Tax=Clostridium thermarum TaxID=1716543 RepID=UPI001FACFE28|nr:GspE/PulE family protein [Clostridium thermarum]